MQLNELRTFLAIIETGSLIKASEQLNVTQSTVTARLKSLEGEIGQTLINRQKSGVSLTAAGVRFQRYASTITNLWRQARQETSLPDALSTVCNIGCHPDLWPALGNAVLIIFAKKYRKWRCRFGKVALKTCEVGWMMGWLILPLLIHQMLRKDRKSFEA